MDTRRLVQGTTLYLPVEVEGALFSCGNAHAAQGDGEVCVTGIEAPMHGEPASRSRRAGGSRRRST
jgi:acetamidase/formamidase